MTRLRQALGKKALHFLLGAIFTFVFSWPLFGFDNAFSTWSFLYGSWAVVVGILFVLSLSKDDEDETEDADV